MTSKLGIYWSVSHRRAQDYDYFKRLQPSVFKIMDGGPPDYQFAKDFLPNSLVIARDWALSEQHADMLKDPVGTGKRHAQEWDNHQTRLGFDKANTLILGINEPTIWQPGVPEALRQYTIALCDEASRRLLRVGAMQLSVGWPNNDGPDTPPNWSQWHDVDNAIRTNRGALVCHEYWADKGPLENWGWWAGRVLKCPWQVPIVIGECGVDMFVKDGSVERHKRGWQPHMQPERYARELAEYVRRMSADSRFVGCCVFAADFADDDWFSFDIERAYQSILATPIPASVTTHLPVIVGDGPTPIAVVTPPVATPSIPVVSVPSAPQATVKAAILNVRDFPGTVGSNIVKKISQGEKISILEEKNTDGSLWYRIGEKQWVIAAWVEKVEQMTSDNWERAIVWVLGQEGGWADDPNDPGGATNYGITIGTYTRWRQTHNQPAPTKNDLRDISNSEVRQIYREWYWNASGSDNLDWPLCLIHFNIAVNGGLERSKKFLNASSGNFLLYMATAMEWYTRINGWKHFGAAWTRRNAALLREASK